MAAITPPTQSEPSPQTGRPASSAAAAAKRGGGGAGAAGGPLMGKYELGRLLGHGTFAKVYHARHVDTGDNVAIKVLDKEKAVKSGLVPHIKREIAVLRRVRHPNIVHLFEVMATKTKIYFVMELVRGGELFSRVSKGRLREDTARRYFQQLVSAVGFCHARGVFHRDLKPENLLVDEQGNLKVSDFGLSAVAEQFRPDGLLHTFCGTPAYVAPEVLGRRGYDGAKADVWSCGVILFVLMAGYLPFHDKNIMAMYKKIYKGEFRCARWFSKDLTSLLMRILHTNPNTRITLPEIMESRWFKKGFKPVKFYIEDDQLHNVIDDEDGLLDMGPAGPVPPPLPPPPPPLPPPKVDGDESGSDSDSSISSCPASMLSDESQRPRGSLPRPASLNAFDIISFSRGFNLSGLFEEKGDEVRFISAEPMSDIITKLEDIAKLKSFKLRRKDWRICLEGTREGVKGPLTIGAEIFELTPPLVMVEVKKKAGDNEEYENFCDKELKPGMQHLVHHMVRAPSMLLTDAK
ncbi:protein kinase 4 [Zea mays]|jgi:serine/threonine protein kinase|uniref:non-specific serine/threonine protein kinase n=1 Tax=Zea mays TaxID=4577 RepID=C0P7I2_MAIZE|nr:protein kinase 4 [Zea mays]ACN28948.1 unknown [Zea mays]ONM37730.1 CBL-interacting serine/threonine-protein kinase 18 [Zea mays]ONM37732.1 CBL-interacting serine/threonine-protein kinase 18 [Zea mays]|eukprot:NP_001104940.2 protein kinase 4 [Zea mays]